MKDNLTPIHNANIPSLNDDLSTWLTYLETIHTQSIDLGLQRSFEVAESLNLLKPAPLIITVGGTNGKGTTCRAIELFLLEAGFRVGVYSSPHLIRYNERVRINNEELEDDLHIKAFDYLEKKRGATSLTYFEFGTLSALYLFKEAQLDVVILEVGLGGRLDSCNIIDANIAVITSIDIDHIDWLGSSRDEIAKEKAGIFRTRSPAVIGEPSIPETLIEVAKSIDAPLFEVGQSWHYTEDIDCWHWYGPDFSLKNLPYPKIPTANAATAIATLYISGFLNCSKERITPAKIIDVLLKVSMPGRFDVVQTQYLALTQEESNDHNKGVLEMPKVILDVGHNPHAARYLTAQILKLKQQLLSKTNHLKIHLVIGMLQDKDIVNTLAPITKIADSWHFISLVGPRGAKAEELAHILHSTPNFNSSKTVLTYDTMTQALSGVDTLLNKGDIIVVCGSFYTVAEYFKAKPTHIKYTF